MSEVMRSWIEGSSAMSSPSHGPAAPSRASMWTVTTFALVPGAGGAAWYWHRVVPLLEQAGHEAVAVDLPGDDPAAGLREYAALVLDAVAGRDDVVVVGQSMGGFTAPIVAARPPVAGTRAAQRHGAAAGRDGRRLVGRRAVPKEARVAAARAGGYAEEFDLDTYFLHDVDPASRQVAAQHQRPEAERAFETPCAIEAWPDVPTRVVAGADDRFFPRRPPASRGARPAGTRHRRRARRAPGRALAPGRARGIPHGFRRTSGVGLGVWDDPCSACSTRS